MNCFPLYALCKAAKVAPRWRWRSVCWRCCCFAVGVLPSGNTQKAAASTAQTATVSQYQTQLEQQLEELISQLQGAGRTTVMVTLTTGEETIYAVDTQTGDLQQQETHVLLQDGSALAETTYLPQVCGVAVLCEGGGDVRVAARITELLHSLLDLPANRICVEQRKC